MNTHCMDASARGSGCAHHEVSVLSIAKVSTWGRYDIPGSNERSRSCAAVGGRGRGLVLQKCVSACLHLSLVSLTTKSEGEGEGEKRESRGREEKAELLDVFVRGCLEELN